MGGGGGGVMFVVEGGVVRLTPPGKSSTPKVSGCGGWMGNGYSREWGGGYSRGWGVVVTVGDGGWWLQ